MSSSEEIRLANAAYELQIVLYMKISFVGFLNKGLLLSIHF